MKAPASQLLAVTRSVENKMVRISCPAALHCSADLILDIHRGQTHGSWKSAAMLRAIWRGERGRGRERGMREMLWEISRFILRTGGHQHTMRFGSTAKVLLKCKLKYYRILECQHQRCKSAAAH